MSSRSFVSRMLLAALLLGACTSAQGTFSVTLQWAATPPTFDPAVFLFSRVEERDVNPGTPGTVLASVGPVSFTGASVSLSFPTVPNGSNRVVVVEIHATSDASSQVLYYGTSQPFALSAGQNTVVPVLLSLQAAPGTSSTSPEAVAIVATGAAGYVNNSVVKLLLTTDTGASVQVANSAAGVQAATAVMLNTLSAAPGSSTQLVLPGWSLEAGLPAGGCNVATAVGGCARQVYAQFTDVNGYASPVVSASVVLDEVAPSLTSASVTPAEATTGDTLAITLAPSEPLSVLTPTVMLAGAASTLAFAASPQSPDVFTHAVVAGDANGAYTVTFSLTDLAGNTTASVPAPALSFSVDTTVPTITELTTSAAVYSEVAGFNALTATFVWSKSSPPASLDVTLAGSPLTCTPPSFSSPPFVYTCTYLVTDVDPAGAQSLQVLAVDDTGNVVSASTTVTLDFTLPVLATDLAVPAVVTLGQDEYLYATASKPLIGAPLMTVMGPSPSSLTFELTSSDLTYEYTALVPATDQGGLIAGNYTTSFELADVVGHVNSVPGPTFAVSDANSNMPTITGVSVSGGQGSTGSLFSAQAGFKTVTVTFGWNNGPGTPPANIGASIAGNAFACASQASTPPPYLYSCTYSVTGSEPQGIDVITIQGTSTGGLVASAAIAVTLDFTAPTLLAAPAASQPTYGLGDTVSFALEPSEPLAAGSPLIMVTNGSGGTLAFTQSGLTFSHVVAPADLAGSYSVQWTLKDTVGNISAELPSPAVSFAVDTTNPTVTITSGSGATYSRVTGFNQASIGVTESEASASVTASVGGAAMQCVVQSNPANWICTHAVGLADTAGENVVSVTAVALSGNMGTATTTVLYDFTAPTLLATPVAPVNPTGLGQTISFTVQPSETLASGFPQIQVTGASAPTFIQSGLSFTHVVNSADTTGTYSAQWILKDVVGNTSAALPSPAVSFAVDSTTPTATITSGAGGLYSHVGGFSQVTIGVTTSEASAIVAGTVGSASLSCSVQSPATTWLCTYSVTGADTAGAHAIRVTATAPSGNFGVATTTVTFDFTAPSLAAPAVVAYVPAASNVLSSVSAATVGTAMNVAFTVSEALASAPVVVSAPSGLAFSQVSATGTSYVFTATLTTAGSPADGQYGLSFTVTDLAGNSTVLTPTLPQLTLKTSAPSAPDTTTVGSVVYGRTPWGSAASGGTPLFTLTGAAAAATGSKSIIVYDGPNPGTADVIGGSAVDGTGAFAATLSAADRVSIYVAGVDAAGNSSVLSSIHDVSWTASLDGKVSGSTVANPNVVIAATDFDLTSPGFAPSLQFGAVVQAAATAAEPASYAGLSDEAGESLTTTGAGTVWTNPTLSSGIPPARAYGAAAYDSIRGRSVFFGGQVNLVPLADTWEWDGLNWTSPASSSAAPPPRFSAGMVYDSARGRTILFGGDNGSTLFSDTWEWDGSTWTQPAVSGGNSPPARGETALAYDSVRGRTVLFGGNGGSGTVLSDTWEWDGSTWSNVTPAGSGNSPTARSGHSLTYDEARQVTVLFGGTDVNDNPLGDTWVWSGSSWTLANAGNPSTPSPRSDQVMVYDRLAGTSTMFGGFDGSEQAGDTWSWDGANWTMLNPIATLSSRMGPAATYDSARGRTVLFGGFDGAQDDSDTWEWAGGDWADVTPSSATPGARDQIAMAYDSVDQYAIVFGGTQGNGPLGDTWTWDGANWSSPFNDGSIPPPRFAHAMAFDSSQVDTVMFGGTDGTNLFADTWLWNGGAWFNLTPADPTQSPLGRSNTALAYDSGRDVTVLFGGTGVGGALNDTWEWSDETQTWSQITPTGSSPSARSGHAMAYDSANAVTVLFGGTDASGLENDTWTWNGSTWSQMTTAPASTPAARSGHALAFDSARARTVLVGGLATNALGDNWEWDGTQWFNVTPTTSSPAARSAHAMVYDSVRNRVVLYGGEVTSVVDGTQQTSLLNDTWESPSDPSRRAADLVQFAFSAAGESAPTIESLTIRATMGGTGSTLAVAGDGTATSGAAVAVWNAENGSWTTVLSNNVGVASPSPVTFTAGSAQAAGALVTRPQTVNVALMTSLGRGNGTTSPELVVDDVELNVAYRR